MSHLPVHESDSVQPICPHCERELEHLVARPISSSWLSRRLVYVCPNCRKVLGVTHRKGLMAS